MSNELTVGYWSYRGRVGAILHLLAYCGIPCKLRLYEDQKEWFEKDKQQLGFDYPNLPYIIDGEKKLTESIALMKYIPRKANREDLLGKNDKDSIAVERGLNTGREILDILTRVCNNKEYFEAEKEEQFTGYGQLKDKLTQLNKHFEGKEWFCGYLSSADFFLFEGVDLISELDKSRLEEYPNLLAFHQRFLALPETKAHRESPQFIKLWFSREAAWTNIPGHVKEVPKGLVYGYYGSRGVGMPGRYLLEFLQIPYQEKRYQDYEEWLKDKETLGSDFANLPYLTHAGKTVCESLAIYQYIPLTASRKDLIGFTDEMKVVVTMFNGILDDVKTELVDKLLFSTTKETFEKAKEEAFTQGILKKKLSLLESNLGEKEFLCEGPTTADFILFNLLDLINDMDSAKLNEYPKLAGHYKRFIEVPEIKAYRESDRFPKAWFIPGLTPWNNV